MSHSSSQDSSRTGEALDLRAVLAAARALSGELELERLLARLLSTVLASAGAERAVLLLEADGRLVIEAEGEARAGDVEPAVRVLQSIPLETYDRLLTALVLRVARAGELEVLADAAGEGPFTDHPYVLREQPRSILCMPLVNQGRRAAILYLENNLSSGAFHPGRVELLELLAAEMAITLDNARLYRELEARVAARTRDLAARNRELHETVEQLRATREQLVQREKMAALGRMAAGVAHEIRNPLNFVNNFARLSVAMAEELEAMGPRADLPAADELLGELKENAARIEEHGRRAAGIVDGMLLHARPTEGERVPTDLNALVRRMVELVHHGLRARDPSLSLRFDATYDEAVSTIVAVPQELGRVFLNLLENAGQATLEKAREAGPGYSPSIQVRTAVAGERVRVTVRDNGPGIASRHLDKVFEPFFTTKPPGEGIGLGLSVSHEIVERHGGEIRVASRAGEGAEFTVVLPLGARIA